MSDTGTDLEPVEDTGAREGEAAEEEVVDPYADLQGVPIYPANDPLNGAWSADGSYSPSNPESEDVS